MHILTRQEIETWLQSHSDWSFKDDQLIADFKFSDFTHAFSFLSMIAIEMQQANHHATITNTYNEVNLKLSTHDAENKVTKKDTDLAATISKRKGQIT